MMRFLVLLSLWSVTSCIGKIPEVAKTNVSKPGVSHSPLKVKLRAL